MRLALPALAAWLVVSFPASGAERAIDKEIVVPAALDKVWESWTTREGIRGFFAPDAEIEPRVGGAFHIHIDPLAQPGARGADDMRRAHAVGIVRRLGGKELGVGEDDAQLVIEAMKERGKIARILGGRAISSHGPQRWRRPRRRRNAQAAVVGDEMRNPSGCRHSESVKMRMLPPAVRTYSTLPAAIQL